MSRGDRRAKQIAAGIIPISSTDVPMLLEWLKDISWPGAATNANHLPSYGENLRPALVAVFDSGDAIWTRWVLAALSDSFDGRFWRSQKHALQRIAYGKDIEGEQGMPIEEGKNPSTSTFGVPTSALGS